MLTIQQGAQQILSDNPGKLYFFTGPEYGVKFQYLESLKNHYSGRVEEYASLSNLLESLSHKSLLPRVPTLYIVRYDTAFLKSLSKDSKTLVASADIVGTIVGIYQEDKEEVKLDKYFPDCVLRLNLLTPEVQKKHLAKKFASLPEKLITAAIQVGEDYYQSQLICYNLSLLPQNESAGMSVSDVSNLFGHQASMNSNRFKEAIAARNFKVASEEIDKYDGDISLLFYDILSTYIEIAKMLGKTYGESFVSPYLKKWDMVSLKTMYDITYEQLERLRSTSSYSPYISIMYVCSLLQFRLG